MSQVGKKWNVFAVDLKNEPHGAATWGKGNYMTDWNGFAERLIKSVAPSYDGLFFVEGVDWGMHRVIIRHAQLVLSGGDLSGVKSKPINTGNSAWNKRVVYAPHTYGPEEWDHGMFQTADFPRNMPAYWDKRYGFVEKQTGNPVVVGEWGQSVPERKPVQQRHQPRQAVDRRAVQLPDPELHERQCRFRK